MSRQLKCVYNNYVMRCNISIFNILGWKEIKRLGSLFSNHHKQEVWVEKELPVNCDLLMLVIVFQVVHEWPGLPKGVKFDPSDQELLYHLIAKVGNGNAKSHPFINEFIPTVEEVEGICYTHPRRLPGSARKRLFFFFFFFLLLYSTFFHQIDFSLRKFSFIRS